MEHHIAPDASLVYVETSTRRPVREQQQPTPTCTYSNLPTGCRKEPDYFTHTHTHTHKISSKEIRIRSPIFQNKWLLLAVFAERCTSNLKWIEIFILYAPPTLTPPLYLETLQCRRGSCSERPLIQFLLLVQRLKNDLQWKCNKLVWPNALVLKKCGCTTIIMVFLVTGIDQFIKTNKAQYKSVQSQG